MEEVGWEEGPDVAWQHWVPLLVQYKKKCLPTQRKGANAMKPYWANEIQGGKEGD